MNSVHIRNVDLNLMPVFEAVYDSGSVAVAAESLGLTQPAVSHALRRLREALGDELFVRQGRRMKPTPRAEAVIPLIRGGLEHFHRVVSGARKFDPATSERTFRISMPDYVEWLLMAKTVEQCHREAPWVRLQVRRPDALFVPPEEELRRGALDASLGFFPDVRGLSSTLHQQEVLRDRNVLVARRGHPALRRRLTFEEFADLPQAAVIYGPEARGFIDREMSARGRPRRLAFATPHFLSALRVVAETDLVACLPQGLVQRLAREWGLASRPIPFEMPDFVLRLLWPRAMQDDADHAWFRQVVLAVGGQALAISATAEEKRSTSSRVL